MDRGYSIGRVLGDGVEVMRRGFGSLAAITLALSVVPGIVNVAVVQPMLGGLGADPTARQAALLNADWGLLAPSYLVFILIYSAQLAALVHASAELLDGRRPAFAASLQHGFSRALPWSLLTLLMSVALTIGFTLLLVPGLILLVRWSAALQAVTLERTGVFAAFGRSAALTRGSRWRILLLNILFLLTLFGFGLLTSAPQALLAAAGAPAPYAVYAWQFLVSGAFTIYLAAVAAAHYAELRSITGGARPEYLAEVFA